jgi:hypothetical protein
MLEKKPLNPLIMKRLRNFLMHDPVQIEKRGRLLDVMDGHNCCPFVSPRVVAVLQRHNVSFDSISCTISKAPYFLINFTKIARGFFARRLPKTISYNNGEYVEADVSSAFSSRESVFYAGPMTLLSPRLFFSDDIVRDFIANKITGPSFFPAGSSYLGMSLATHIIAKRYGVEAGIYRLPMVDDARDMMGWLP